MKYSNETIAKVIAPYLGCEVVDTESLHGVLHTIYTDRIVFLTKNGEPCIRFFSEFKLLLRPLASISDKDAIEVAKIADDNKEHHTPSWGKMYAIKGILYDKEKSWLVYQYLQLQDYSLPHILLDGLDPITAGIAIEKI